MISVTTALDHLFALVDPMPVEHVPLINAHGRILAQTVHASRTQPPFAASAMDGYAVLSSDVKNGATLTVIGESAAGHSFDGTVAQGQALRIFTGAPVPDGADRVVIQEDVERSGNQITIGENLDTKTHIRAAGQDFAKGDPMEAPRRLTPSEIALLAAMNIASVPVATKPVVAIIATGDELVQPGETPNADQIIASNSYGLAALLRNVGAEPRLLPIARDNHASLALALHLAKDADLIITIGGASVGDHDLVAQAAANNGMEQSFYKVAMRPGKPLMAGKIGTSAMIGLPGNPVSAMVCGHVFILPVIRKMLGLGQSPAALEPTILAHDIPKNGPRQHYMRGKLGPTGVQVFERQDSALLSVLASANCLVVRPPNAGPRAKGALIDILRID